MWQQIVTSKKFLFSLSLIALVALAFSFIKPRSVLPELMRSSPANNQTNVGVLAPVELQFKGDVDPRDLALASTPNVSWEIIPRSDTAVVFTHEKPLQAKTKYSLTLSWRGQPLTTLSFETEATQTDYELIKNTKALLARDYPLAGLIPYDTPLYRVVYSAPLTLQITLKNPTTTKDQATTDIQAWVKSGGQDPATHQYVFGK